jgi:hypothetical protein
MFKIAAIIFLFLSNYVSAQSCLPELKIKDKQSACRKNSDCVIIGDACRSCQMPIVANKKFKSKIEKKDRQLREAAGCVLSCEACDQSKIIPVCKKSKCSFEERSENLK